MYITNFEISNFKSYREPGTLEFKPGFNIITGQNSAGKTALLEALTLNFEGNPHRSVITIPIPGVAAPDPSSVRMTFVVSREELLPLIAGDSDLYFPRPTPAFAIPSVGLFNESGPILSAFTNWVINQPEYRVSVRMNKTASGGENWFAEEPTLGLYPGEAVQVNGNRIFIHFRVNARGEVTYFGGQTDTSRGADVSIRLGQVLRSKIYRFRAERFSLGESPFGANPVLAGNADNLPEVLNVLKANTNRFLQLGTTAREILPQIKHVSVRALIGNRVQIIIWPHDAETQREDLAIPLDQCGSGVGQVLAILYVVMTSDQPRTLIIDEPQSFLHPGAVRKLIDVLKRYPQHQYIFATHSPTVITASDPNTLTVARLSGVETTFQKIDPTDNRDLQMYLAEIGARLSDVFGAENILWVEGQTEEQCYPLIIKGLLNRSLMGTVIVGIRETGDLEGRDAKKFLELHRRVSTSSSLLPPTVGFLLDKECRTQADIAELQRLSDNRATFLLRRMYENYLLSSAAIAAVVNDIDGFRPAGAVSQGEIGALIDRERLSLANYCPGTTEVPVDWIWKIHAAKVLQTIFGELSETRVSFRKTLHSVALTEWLIANDREQLREIADVLSTCLTIQTRT